MDNDDSRTRTLILDGAKHKDSAIRMSCVKMLPIIMSGNSLRETALELISNESDEKIIQHLNKMAIDVSIEGTEAEKNRFLAPLPKSEDDEQPSKQIKLKSGKIQKKEEE